MHTALDGQHVPHGVSLEVSLPWPRVAQRHWPAHPLCGCSGLAGHNGPVTDLPRKAVTRTAKLASLPLGFAGRTALGLGKRVGGKPAEMVAAEVQARTAEQLFKVLGELKGGAMKFGQALSVFEAALPEELAAPYRATLTKLQDAAPPMPAAAVHRVLAEELGPRWRRSSPTFDDTPAAAASIGQVHRAVWRDGRDVAVKVQYPGAGEALLGDLNQLSRVARVSAGWIPGLDIKPLLAELKERVAEELDYGLEADHSGSSPRRSRATPTSPSPQVVHQSGNVLVSEWIEGVPLSAIIADGHRRSSATAPPSATWSSCSPVRSGPGCCTPTRTRATSGCCRTAGSA